MGTDRDPHEPTGQHGGPNIHLCQPIPRFMDEEDVFTFSRVRSQQRKAWIE